MRRAPWLRVILVLAAGSGASEAQHAPRPGSPESRRPAAPPPSAPEGRPGLRDVFGVEAARARLGGDDELAIERLGADDGDLSLQELARIAEDSESLGDRALLVLVRALSRRAAEPTAVRSLYSLLARSGKQSGARRRLFQMAREQAALALAEGGSDEGLGLLARMVKRGHDDGQLALRALAAHPPRDLSPLWSSPGAANLTLVELVEALGDQRAFVPLRELVRRGSPDVQARAALALTRLGHLETIELARHWLSQPSRPEQLAAATEILMQVKDEGAAKAWTRLYESDREGAIQLAFDHPQPALAEPLARALEGSTDRRLLALLGQSGGERAMAVSSEYLDSEQGASAVYALARSPDERATSVLAAALSSQRPELRRWAALGLVVRHELLGQGSSELGGALDALRGSSVPADRWAGIFGLSVLKPAYALAQLESRSELALRAAVASAGVQGDGFFERCAELLPLAETPDRRELLGVALLRKKGSDRVPSHLLEGWVNAGSPLMSLSIAALSARDDARFEDRIARWLESTSSSTRISASLGLAEHRAPWATGKLVRAFAFEEIAEVRLAIMTALSGREPAPSRQAVLDQAARLDVDARVRVAAQLARGGQELSPSPLGTEAAWLEIPDGPVPDWLLVESPGGLSVPVPTGGQRVVVVLGARSADVRVRLAPSGRSRDDAPRDSRKQEGR